MTTVTTLTYDQVMSKLPAIVADCLGIDLEDVTPEMVFCEESIEFLDLSFRCERAFGIKSPFRFFLGSRDQLKIDAEGYFTSESMDLIRRTYPFFTEKIAADGKVKLSGTDLLNYFTVDMIAKFVLHAASEQAANSQAA